MDDAHGNYHDKAGFLSIQVAYKTADGGVAAFSQIFHRQYGGYDGSDSPGCVVPAGGQTHCKCIFCDSDGGRPSDGKA